jgi:hypothetical protein
VLPDTTFGYEYDVFISYPHAQPALDWMVNHFHPLFTQWLAHHLPHEPRVFIDSQIEAGTRWPDVLAHALKRSKAMVAVWTPPYFRSPWCMAEWQSMRERERMLGLFCSADPRGLAFPVVFADGRHFPLDVLENRQYRDLKRWNIPQRSFAETAKYSDFNVEMEAFAEYVADKLLNVPTWRDDFPLIYPPPAAPPAIELPRL